MGLFWKLPWVWTASLIFHNGSIDLEYFLFIWYMYICYRRIIYETNTVKQVELGNNVEKIKLVWHWVKIYVVLHRFLLWMTAPGNEKLSLLDFVMLILRQCALKNWNCFKSYFQKKSLVSINFTMSYCPYLSMRYFRPYSNSRGLRCEVTHIWSIQMEKMQPQIWKSRHSSFENFFEKSVNKEGDQIIFVFCFLETGSIWLANLSKKDIVSPLFLFLPWKPT